jgi:arylsulfatase A-like enzyme
MDKGQLTAEQLGQQLKSHIAAKPGEVFLAQVAQKAGYKTAQFGKLDWGFQTTRQRLKRHDWVHHLGDLDHQRAHGFYPTYLWLNGQKLPLEGNTNINAARTKESYGKGTTARRRVHLRLKKTTNPSSQTTEFQPANVQRRQLPSRSLYDARLLKHPEGITHPKGITHPEGMTLHATYKTKKGHAPQRGL